MKQQISSSSTALWKFVFPSLWIPMMAIAAVASAHISHGPALAVFLCLWLVASGYIIWFAWHLKLVSVDEKTLYVSGYRKEIQIPFSHVKEVKENFGSKPRVITLTLNQPSEFGDKVLFVPAPLSFGPFRSHPVVEQLRKLISSNCIARSITEQERSDCSTPQSSA